MNLNSHRELVATNLDSVARDPLAVQRVAGGPTRSVSITP